MTTLFPDNTVLVNFALIRRVALLGELVSDRAWSFAVAQECSKSARVDGLEDLAEAQRLFGTPLTPTTVEMVRTRTIRDLMLGPGDDVTAHIGEAETFAIVLERRINAAFATDDRNAQAVARAHGIHVISTWDLLALAVRASLLSADECVSDCRILRKAKRGGPPGANDDAAVRAWLATRRT